MVTFALLWRAGRRATGVFAPVRLAAVRAAVVTGTFAVLAVEVAGAAGALRRPVFALLWVAATGVAAVLAGTRHGRAPHEHASHGTGGPRARGRHLVSAWRRADRTTRLLAGALGTLLLAELVVALLAEPNNYDSLTYHLPRIEHWVAQGDLGFYATAVHRQVTLAPGAEYLLLHLRLLTGGDSLYHLVQWCAGVGCLLAASRIAGQLGGSARAQWVTVFVVGTVPMVTLQASSTQNDLVTAAWTACAATLALDGLRRLATIGDIALLGAAVGLTAVTKTSGLLGAAPMLVLWCGCQLRLVLSGRTPRDRTAAARLARVAAAAVGVIAVAATLVGPFINRVYEEFGHPLGPSRLRHSVPLERHDPPAIFVNAARIVHTATDTPLPQLREASVRAIEAMADALGVDPQDRDITFGVERFPDPAWHPDEDRVSFPITVALVTLGAGLALVRPRWLVGRAARAAAAPVPLLRAYACAVVTTGVLYASTVKWQPWGNRLLLFALVLAAPLAGLAVAAFPRHGATRGVAPGQQRAGERDGRSFGLARAALAATLVGSAVAGMLAVGYGFPRRLVGGGSTLATDEWDTRFLRRPQWAQEYRWAAEGVISAGAERVGLVQQNNNWEYPWWLLLRGRELVALESVLPRHPPADPTSVDAIVCAGDRQVCADLVPDGWSLAFGEHIGFALPVRQH